MMSDVHCHRRDTSEVARFSRAAAYCARYFWNLAVMEFGVDEEELRFVLADLRCKCHGLSAILMDWVPDIDTETIGTHLVDDVETLRNSAETAVDDMLLFGKTVGAPLLSKYGMSFDVIFPNFRVHLADVTRDNLSILTFLSTVRSATHPTCPLNILPDYEVGACMKGLRKRLAHDAPARSCAFCGGNEGCRQICRGCVTTYCSRACMDADRLQHEVDCLNLSAYFETRTADQMTGVFLRLSKNG